MKISNGDIGTLETELLRSLPRLLPSLRVTRTSRGRGTGSSPAGLLVDVTTPMGKRRRLVVGVRVAEPPSRVRDTLRRLKGAVTRQPSGYPVLASSFFSPRVREICREEGVGYLDLAGNCFLRLDHFYLEKIVEKNPFPIPGRPPSLFSPVSSRILRALLEEPQRPWTVTELSQATGTSLGQTSNVTRRLLDEAYLTKAQRRLRLAQPAALLDAWREHSSSAATAYHAYYSFERTPDPLMARVAAVAQAKSWRYALTSFAAASLVAPFVHGVGVVQWYVPDGAAVEEWVQALDLRPAESGPNVILRVPYDSGVFYRTQIVQGLSLVGNIQLYLDLSHESARAREQAEFLRKATLTF